MDSLSNRLLQILDCHIMHSLWQQLVLIQTLINCLSRIFMLDNISTPSRIASKTSFTLSPNYHTTSIRQYQQQQPQREFPYNICLYNLHASGITFAPPQFPVYAKTSTTYYLSKILLWSLLQSTFLYSKDLMKLPYPAQAYATSHQVAKIHHQALSSNIITKLTLSKLVVS